MKVHVKGYCSVCDIKVDHPLLSKRWIDPAHPTKILGGWCQKCLPTVRVCVCCRNQTVAGDNPHGYPRESVETEGSWWCTSCYSNSEEV